MSTIYNEVIPDMARNLLDCYEFSAVTSGRDRQEFMSKAHHLCSKLGDQLMEAFEKAVEKWEGAVGLSG